MYEEAVQSQPQNVGIGRSRPITNSLEKLTRCQDELSGALSELEKLLVPVMRSEPVAPLGSATPPRALAECEVHEKLMNITDNVNGFISQVRSILSRLAI